MCEEVFSHEFMRLILEILSFLLGILALLQLRIFILINFFLPKVALIHCCTLLIVISVEKKRNKKLSECKNKPSHSFIIPFLTEAAIQSAES